MGERSVGGTSEQLVERKVRGGKLFRIRIWREGDVAVGVSLTGDFFLEPEEGIERLESALLQAYTSPGPEAATKIIEGASKGLTITGFSPADLVGALEEAGGCRGA
ncbi:MAG: hypothetical protein LUO79_03475 [Methanomassiliicoccales archaeon]|nr:hypothetical protein [Methanomassiliicoccales archaeon]